MAKEHDCELVQGVWPDGVLRLEGDVIGDCFPAAIVMPHVCDGCRAKGGEVFVSLVNPAGRQVACIMFPPEQALVLAETLVRAVQAVTPGKVQ